MLKQLSDVLRTKLLLNMVLDSENIGGDSSFFAIHTSLPVKMCVCWYVFNS